MRMPGIRARAEQLVLALVFLTRLPLVGLLPADRIVPLHHAVWAFPLVGLVVGALAGLPLWLAGPPLLTAALAVALAVVLTGALHEDALADFADAMGGRDRAARLAIMRDSTVGSYGVAALGLTLLIRCAALSGLGPVALLVAATGGRAAILLALATLPPARADGLGQSGQGGVSASVLGGAAVLMVLLLALAGGDMGVGGALAATCAGLIGAGLVIRLARQKLGGQTGDVLGSACLVTETAMLAAFALTA